MNAGIKNRQKLAWLKKNLPLIITGIILSIALTTAKEAKAETYGFEIIDGVLTEYYGPDAVVVIPDTVKSIGEFAFSSKDYVTSVTIPSSVKSIGDGAFVKCTGLETINMGNSVKSIGEVAFYECKSLKSIVIPDSIIEIGTEAFYDCSSLASISFPTKDASIGMNAFENTSWLKAQRKSSQLVIVNNILIDGKTCTGKVTIPDTVKNIGGGAFDHNKSLTKITIPDSVKYIGEGAFGFCYGLAQVTIPSSVTDVGDRAFQYCKNLTKIVLPDSVTSIGVSAFEACEKLEKLSIPASVTKIGENAFENSAWLKAAKKKDQLVIVNHILIDGSSSKGKVVIPKNVTVIAYQAFLNNDKITSVSIPNTVKRIENDAFFSCNNLSKINIPDSVTSIGDNAFYECGLTEISIPKSVKYLGAYAFSHCSKLVSVVNNSSITQIGEETFTYCTSLKKINIPNKVEVIGTSAFEGCYKLTDITIPNSVKRIEDEVFYNCYTLKTIKIPKSVTYMGLNSFAATAWLNNNKEKLLIINGILISGSLSTGNITIPDTVKMIAGGAFTAPSYSCKITGVTIPSSVKYIGDSAFYDCNKLKQITLPNSITEIVAGTFIGCDSLKTITIPASVRKIGKYAFANCRELKSIIIPDSVWRIGKYAFTSCRELGEVYLSSPGTQIHASAFEDCPAIIYYLKITNKKAEISEGKTYQFEAEAHGDSGKIIWSVSDSSIASIEASTGLLTTKKTGTVTITASAGKVKDSCKLIVTKLGQLIITGDRELISGTIGEYKISGIENDTEVIWTVSDQSKAEVVDDMGISSGLLALDAGTVVLTAQTETAQGQLTITIKDFQITGKSTVTMYEDELYTVAQEGNFLWSLSEDSIGFIQEINEGKSVCFTAMEEGKVILTALNTSTGDTASIEITIEYAKAPWEE